MRVIDCNKMDIDYLEEVLRNLRFHYEHIYSAKCTLDQRTIKKKVNSARKQASDYAKSLPSELLGYFDQEVDRDALNYQFIEEDLPKCISALQQLITSEKERCGEL